MAKIENAAIAELDGIPPLPKKRGRPSTGKAKSNSERQRAYRATLRESFINSYGVVTSSSTSVPVLLMRLADAVKRLDDPSEEYREGAQWSFATVMSELNKRYSNV
jgi:hypothetical protein